MGSRRWLILLLVTVAVSNLAYGMAFPVPPHSSHDVFILIPQFQKVLLGYVPTDAGLGVFHPTSFSGERGGSGMGSLWGLLFENNRGRHWTQLPHPVALAAGVARWAPNWLAVQAVFTGYLVVTLVALHGIGCRLAGPRAGFLSACVGAGSPGLFGYSRYLECHLPVACLSTLVVWLLLCTEGLKRWRWCLLVSLVTWSLTRSGEGAAELVAAGLVLVGPATFVAASGLRQALTSTDRRSEALRTWGVGLCLAVGPLVLLSDLAWIQGALIQILTAFRDPPVQLDLLAANGEISGGLSFRLAYLVLIFSDYLGVMLGAALVGALLLFRRWPLSGRVLFLVWCVLPFLAFSWMQRKASWYAVAAVPPLALAVGLGFAKEVFAARVVACVSMVQLLGGSFLEPRNWPSPLAHLRQPIALEDWRLRRVELLRPSSGVGARRLAGEARTLLDWMATELPVDGRMKHVGLLTTGYEHDYAIRYLLSVERPDIEVVSVGDSRLRATHYRGLEASQVQLWLYLDGGFRAWPPEPARVSWLQNALQCQPGDPIDGFVDAVLSQAWKPVVLSPGEVTVYRRDPALGAGLKGVVFCGRE